MPEPEHGLRREAAARSVTCASTWPSPRTTCSTTRSSTTAWRTWTSASRWSRRPTRRCSQKAEQTAAPHVGHPRLQDDRRHHAGAEPVHRRLLPGDAAGGALHARDVLPVRRPPHPPVDDHARAACSANITHQTLHGLLRAADALHRLRQAHRADARRPLRLLPTRSCRATTWSATATRTWSAGAASTTPTTSTTTTSNMTEWGRKRYITPGVVLNGELITTDLVEINLMIRILLGSSYFDDWDERGDVRHAGSARQPGRQAPSVEQGDAAEAAEARLRRTSTAGSPRRACYDKRNDTYVALRHRRRAVRAPVGDGEGRPGGHRLRQGDRREPPDGPAEDGHHARDGARVEDPGEVATRSSATGPGPTTRPTRRWSALHCLERALDGGPGRPDEDAGTTSRCPRRRSSVGFHEAARGVLSHHMVIRDGKIANYQPYPPTPWNASPRDSLRDARAPTRTRCRTRRSSRRTARRTSRASTSCGRCAASTRACRAACTCTPAAGKVRKVDAHADRDVAEPGRRARHARRESRSGQLRGRSSSGSRS